MSLMLKQLRFVFNVSIRVLYSYLVVLVSVRFTWAILSPATELKFSKGSNTIWQQKDYTERLHQLKRVPATMVRWDVVVSVIFIESTNIICFLQGCLKAIQDYVLDKSIIFMAIGGGTLAVQVRLRITWIFVALLWWPPCSTITIHPKPGEFLGPWLVRILIKTWPNLFQIVCQS